MMNQFYQVSRKRLISGVQAIKSNSLVAFMLFSLISLSVSAQDLTVSGKVSGSDGGGLPGVTVSVKGTSKGTSSDISGNYKLAGVPSNGTLVFSFVGMTTQEVAVGGKTTVNVTLIDDAQTLNEVVVVGYGTVKKKDATGAVNAIGTKDFQQGIVTSPEQLMQGRVAGVQITQNSGEPGGGINVRIRGTSSVFGGNQPLFVVDGVPLGSDNTSAEGSSSGIGRQPAKNPLNFMNPADIESIDILKDASATAIYGSRGAQGVVLITTKKGKGKGTLDYGVSFGASTITKKYDLLNASEFAAANPSQNQGGNTDWQDELYRTAMTQQHNLSYGGGDATGNYRFTLGYLDQQGIIETSGIKRYSIGFNGGKKFINNKLNITSSVNLANNQDKGIAISDNAGYTGDLMAAILKSNPTRSVYNADGKTFNQPGIVEPNPVAVVNLSKDRTNTLRALGNIAAELEIVEGLKFKTVLGFDQSLSTRKSAFSRDLALDGVLGIGRLYLRDIEMNNQLWENYFTYDKTFGKTSLNALLGYSYQNFETAGKYASIANFSTSDLDVMTNNLASANAGSAPSNVVNNSFRNFDELQSYFTRVNLNMGKVLVTGTLRVDGSTKFGGNNKYGYFPSGAVKYKLIEENFVPKNVFSDLALRVGYGLVGNQSIPHNLYDRRDRYSDWNPNQGATDISGGGLNAVAFNNPNLKWETTSTLNIGLDFALAGNRVSGNVEFYDKHTKDLLMNVVSAQPAPTPFVWRNLDTDIQNRGLELGLNVVAVDTKKFSWEVVANAAFNKNLIKNLSGVYDTGEINGQGLTGAFAQRLAAGQPMFAFFLREFGGYDAEGNTIYPNGDFQTFVNASPLPTVTAGLTNNFKFGNFDASIFFNGQFGNYIYSNTANAYFTKGSITNGRNVTRDVLATTEGPFNAPDVSTRFLEKGDFVRLQNLNVGYRVPTKGIKNVSSLRLFLTGQNLLTFTKYSGQDPEVSTNKSLNGIPSAGIDYSAFPRSKTWTIGANISF